MEDGKGRRKTAPLQRGVGEGLARFWLATREDKQFIGWLEF